MKFLNLTQGFNPYRSVKSFTIDHKSFTFHGGEPHIVIDTPLHHTDEVTITIKIKSYNDMGLLKVAVNTLNDLGVYDIHLLLPYLPAARQDKKMVDAEPFTSKIYAQDINSLRFKTVTVVDPHSGVSVALLDRCKVIHQSEFSFEVVKDLLSQGKTELQLVSPDQGANKKVEELYKKCVNTFPDIKFNIIHCEKERDPLTGKLLRFKILNLDELDNETPYIIIDDICDGGGTFIGLNAVLEPLINAQAFLAVTHGIFSRGTVELLDDFDSVYTTDSFIDPRSHVTLNVIPLSNIL